jgi:hypothetical protein
MSSQQSIPGEPDTTAESNPTDQPNTPSLQEPVAIPPDATVLKTPRGDQYHEPLGDSLVPKCGARAGMGGDVERMTRYRAEDEHDLNDCDSCFGKSP